MVNPWLLKVSQGDFKTLEEAEYERPWTGVFPGTFKERLCDLAQPFQPSGHWNCEKSRLNVSMIHDGLLTFSALISNSELVC